MTGACKPYDQADNTAVKALLLCNKDYCVASHFYRKLAASILRRAKIF